MANFEAKSTIKQGKKRQKDKWYPFKKGSLHYSVAMAVLFLLKPSLALLVWAFRNAPVQEIKQHLSGHYSRDWSESVNVMLSDS